MKEWSDVGTDGVNEVLSICWTNMTTFLYFLSLVLWNCMSKMCRRYSMQLFHEKPLFFSQWKKSQLGVTCKESHHLLINVVPKAREILKCSMVCWFLLWSYWAFPLWGGEGRVRVALGARAGVYSLSSVCPVLHFLKKGVYLLVTCKSMEHIIHILYILHAN